MADNISLTCVICREGKSSGQLVANPGLDMILSIKEYATKRVELGELDFKPLAEHMAGLSQAELNLVRYHSNCRKKVVNKELTQRAVKRSHSPKDMVVERKVGRPSTSSDDYSRPQRIVGVKPKEKICVFSPCPFEGKEDLHMVETDNRGQTLLDIKQRTNDDRIRACLSSLHEPGDASAQEKWYHSSCIKNAIRSLPQEDETKTDLSIRQRISDIQLIMFVESSISEKGAVLSMTDVNKEYASILQENRIEKAPNQRKYLKELMKKHIPNVEFVRSPRRNESENVVLSEVVGEAVDFVVNQDANAVIDGIVKSSRSLRKELLEYRDKWKFTGRLDDFDNPPLLEFLLKQILFGPHKKHVTGRRDDELHKAVDVLTQVILQNVKTDRQVKYKPKNDAGFVQRAETPVSIGLPLTLHRKVRDKRLVNFISDMYLGSSYRNILNLQERIACGVVERMKETGGYVLPRFVKKDKSIYFAIDNIDFLEDTAFGQDTLHGTIVVINQEEFEDGEPINEDILIPDKPEPVRLDVVYRDEPVISPKPVKFDAFAIDEGTELVKAYKQRDRTWGLAHHLGNVKYGECDPCHEDVAAQDVPPNQTGSGSCTDLTPIEESQKIFNPGTSASIIAVSSDQTRPKKADKQDVMPTWGATNSILDSAKGIQTKKTNSEVIAPLFRQPPTDYATLYTVLMLTQDISAVVVGPERKTVITLDLDLYERALKIQQSVENTNWVLRAGELHICMAALHALAKYVEGSGLDLVAIETSIYSPAALRAIFTGKAFKRGVEYHITNALACFFMRFDAILGESPPEPLRLQCQELRRSLHERDPKSFDLFEALQSQYNSRIGMMSTPATGDLASFLSIYTTQVEALLHLIRASRQNDWEGFLAAIDENIKYFMAHDLYKYARMMPVHLAQMKVLREEDPQTWDALKNGDLCVRKSNTPFTALFVDQTLEQEIKKLKGTGGITGLTQHDELLDRFLITLPELTRLAAEYQERYTSGLSSTCEASKQHYQVTGDVANRLASNALKLRGCVELHCEGNPYANGTTLKNIVSSLVVAEAAKEDILRRDEKGQSAYKTFVDERMIVGSEASIWDPMKKLKLKTHSTWMCKQTSRVGDKVIKLREERELLARFLVIQQARPELVPMLPNTIGDYEMSVIPRSLFANDGSLLIPTDKSSIMHSVEAISVGEESLEQSGTADELPTDEIDDEIMDSTTGEAPSSDTDMSFERVIIFDAMGVLQSMKKTSAMTKISHLKTAFIKKISSLMKGYKQGRVIFDRYLEVSLKNKTRAKRAQKTPAAAMEFVVHDEMNIAKVSLKELLSNSKTKSQLTEQLAEGLLENFKDCQQDLVVCYEDKVRSNRHDLLPDDMKIHSHEEADTMIPLHVLDVIRESTVKAIDVMSPDTDVLILLMDLAANAHLGGFTKLRLLTGKGAKRRVIDVRDRVSAIGLEKSKGLIGLHDFTGADWGGKFVGISKKTWVSAFLSLPPEDEVVQAFANMGHETNLEQDLGTLLTDDGNIAERYRPFERFVCKVYSQQSKINTLPALRWELFRRKNLEGEKLPPTRGTLLPHILRANYMSLRDKTYISATPELPPIEQNGWEVGADQGYVPVKCLKNPALDAVLELVKCGCRGSCDSVRCSCLRNGLNCTALCKCTDCSNVGRYSPDGESDDVDL